MNKPNVIWCLEVNGDSNNTYAHRPGISSKDYNSKLIYWRKKPALARLAKWRAWGVDCTLYESTLNWKPNDE